MVKSRQRNEKNQLIFTSRKSILRELLITLFSIVAWCYCLTVVFFFISALVDYNNKYINLFKAFYGMTNSDIRSFLFTGIFILIVFLAALLLWSRYNKNRYGTMTRRKAPLPATKEDLLSLGYINEDDYDQLQKAKVIAFKQNPIEKNERTG